MSRPAITFAGLSADVYAAGRAAQIETLGYAEPCAVCGAPLLSDEEERGTCDVCAANRCARCRGRGALGGFYGAARPCPDCGGTGAAKRVHACTGCGRHIIGPAQVCAGCSTTNDRPVEDITW